MLKKRVCFVIPSLGVGGTERQLLYLLKGLLDEFEIMVICTSNDGAWVGEARRLGRVKVLNFRGGWDPRLKGRLRQLFRTYPPDVVHSFMFGFDHVVNVAARAEGVAAVISSRRQQATWKKPRHIRLQLKANKLVNAIVANSHVVAEFSAEQENRPIKDYRVIHNGIDVEGFQSRIDVVQIRERYQIPDGKRVVGIIANFSPVKDHALFIEMARLLSSHRGDVHFVMAGKGPLIAEIGQKLQEYALQDVVTGLTTLSELEDVYTMLDVCVLTSKNEGFPNVVMEAMASGTPVVAANVGGIPELIERGRGGTLIDTRNPEDFADAVETYLDNLDLAQETGARGREFVRDNLSLNGMIKKYKELYSTLLAARGVQ